MDLDQWHGAWPYLAVLVGAAVEGEALFSVAAVLVGLGRLDPFLVWLSGSIGAAAGDQFYFFLVRGRFSGWLDRLRLLSRHRPAIVRVVHGSATLLVLAIRFSPGLRIAIAAACAYAGVPAWRFSLLNALSACVWAAVLLATIAWLGPTVFSTIGLGRAWAAVIPALVLFVVARSIGRLARDAVGRRVDPEPPDRTPSRP